MSKVLKLIAVLSVVWLLVVFLYACDVSRPVTRWGDYLSVGQWDWLIFARTNVLIGMLPLVVLWGAIWTLRGQHSSRPVVPSR